MTTSFGAQRAVSGRFDPRVRPSGRLRAHSSHSPLWFHQRFAGHPQIAQRKQRHQVGRVLGQPFVFDFHKSKLPFDHSKRVFNLGPDAGLGLLQLLQNGAHRGALVQRLAFAGRHGHMPVRLVFALLNFLSLLDTPVARVGVDVCFLAMQQLVRLGDVVIVGSSGNHRVHQPRVSVHAYMNTKGLPASRYRP